MSKVIDIVGISKEFKLGPRKKITALNNVAFSINQGEAFGFVGPNGAGKSTTIKILTGLIKPSSGHAIVLGHDVSSPKSRQGLGYVPENPCLSDYLTPTETLMMAIRMHGTHTDNPLATCMQWLERFDMTHAANRRIRSFSKGMVQRTALAHAMVINPQLLILDEPLSGLDPIGRKLVVDVLLEYRRQGGTVMFSSHVLHDVERLADRFGLIHQGTLRTVQRPDELVGGTTMVMVRSIGKESVSGLVQDIGGRWYGEVPNHDLWALLRAMESAGHNIIEIKPSMSLEQAFLKYVTGTSPAAQRSLAQLTLPDNQ